MTRMGNHAKESMTADQPRRDHLWVLLVIAACALLEVWASWLGIGSVSGFPKLGILTTGWILPVTTEAYWGYALYAWLAGPSGRRSRRFAMWTAIGMFALSLGGQESGHLIAASHRTAPWYVVGFVTALPLIAVALIAVLIHLRQLDREEAVEVAEESALRAELRDAHAARVAAEAEPEALRAELETVRSELSEALAKCETLTRKLSATSGRKATRNSRAKRGATAGRGQGENSPATEVPKDVDARAEALAILAAEPDISGAKLGERVGKSERWGQLFKNELAKAAPQGPDAEEAS